MRSKQKGQPFRYSSFSRGVKYLIGLGDVPKSQQKYSFKAFLKDPDRQKIDALRLRIEDTVSKLKARQFQPHGASRCKQLQSLRNKRSIEPIKLKEVVPYRMNTTIEGSPQESIACCSLKQSIFYG